MKLTAIVFLFLALSKITRSQYFDTAVKRLRKFEKNDYRLRNAEPDQEFLVRYR